MRKHRQYPIIQPQRDIRAITQERIIEYLYLLSERAHQRVVDAYCHKQMQLIEKQPFFIRGYNTYTHSSMSLNDISNVHPLHESLVESFDEYLFHRRQQVFRDVHIKNTIANALNITITISDILELLPPAITNAFSNGVLKTIRCVEPTVTTADIEKFTADNEQGIQLIREQLLSNMLEG
jgi:hypothetical protein